MNTYMHACTCLRGTGLQGWGGGMLKKKEKKDLVTELKTMKEFMYLVFTHMPGESYHRQLGSLLLCLTARVRYFKYLLTPLCAD